MRSFMIAAALLAAGAAQAQTQDWTFSDFMTGTQVTDAGALPYSGVLTGTVVLSGSGADEMLTYNFTAPTPAGFFDLASTETLALGNTHGNGQAATGWLTPVLVNGVVTGFTGSLNNTPVSYNAYTSLLSVGTTGATMQWLASVGDCSQNINCTVNASGTGGAWKATAVPELDSGRTLTALTLLVGGVLLLRARRA